MKGEGEDPASAVAILRAMFSVRSVGRQIELREVNLSLEMHATEYEARKWLLRAPTQDEQGICTPRPTFQSSFVRIILPLDGSEGSAEGREAHLDCYFDSL